MSVLHAMNSSHTFHRSEPALGFFLPAYAKRVRSVSPQFSASAVKKRSYSDTDDAISHSAPTKRSRTAPSSPPAEPQSLDKSPIRIPLSLGADAPVSSVKLPSINAISGVNLPSINDALGFSAAPIRTVIPTVSLDYFDTYKPNDENWRYGLLDSIRKSKSSAALEQCHQKSTTTLPSIREMDSKVQRPQFDSRVGKSFPTLPQQRKINFPYESNYTYLNSTYMKDVEKFPEYLELAQSLVQLSKPEKQAKFPYTDKYQNEVSPPTQYAYPFKQGKIHNENQPSANHAKSPSHKSSPQSKSACFAPKSPSNVPHKFIPITPPSVRDKSRSDLMKSPPKSHSSPRMCISCGSDQSPCWRPSWSTHEGQLCNSCGLRYKKTAARCLNDKCRKIPAKGEWALMQTEGMKVFEDGVRAHKCLECGWKVDTRK